MAQKYKQLHFVTLQSLVNWSVAHLINRDLGFTKKFPFARIGDVITRSTLLIHVEDDVLYKQVTVKTNGGGVVLRNENLELGKNIGTKTQYLAKEGQFIMSKIDARNGAFGIITNELDGAIVTSDFPLFDVNTKLVHPFYLYLLSTTKPFIQYAQSCSRGTTNRQRIDVDSFLSQKIPLPSLEEQKNIVSTYNAKIEQANIYSLCTYRINKKIEDYLHNILETNIEFDISGSFLNYVNYKDISRWDALFLLSNNNIKSKYPLATLGQCISHFLTDQNGKSLRRETYKTPEKEYTYIGMENVKKETGEIIDNVIVKGKDIKSQTIYVPSNYFLYGKLRPYLNKYWYNNIETQQEEIICSSEFFVFDIKNNINSKYFLYVLASYIVQKQIIDAMSGARMPRISEETFRGIQIPLPPLNIQNEIVEHIDVLRKEQKDLQQKALTLRQQATQQFEQTIFSVI